jgi:diguanylate cyclase (GGDEF)-like protein
MAPMTAVNYVFVGLALLGLGARRPGFAACANWLAVPPLFLSTLAIVGYAYGVSSLYKIGPFTSMALDTALSFFIFTLSIMAANTAHGIGNLLISETAGGAVARKLLPTLPLAIFALGWLRLEGERAGLYDMPFGLALGVLLSIVVIVFAVTSTAVKLRKVDLTRRRAEAALGDLNERLEQRVQERTRELAGLSEELTAANASLEKLSLHDALTSLANRRFFDEYITGQLAVARRRQQPLALVLIDIDAFKAYNDRYGHQAGDECLRNVAAALRSCCRRPADMAARYGGEEFALILPDTDLAGAVRIAEMARNAVGRLRAPHAESPTGRFVSISGGAAVLFPSADATVEQLIAAADEHLFEAKRLGRNRIVSARAAPAAFAIAAGNRQ